MASDNGGDYVRGEMDIDMHKQTYRGFLSASKWLSVVILALTLWLTVWFALGAGFVPATITAVAFIVAGGFFVKFFFPKPEESH